MCIWISFMFLDMCICLKIFFFAERMGVRILWIQVSGFHWRWFFFFQGYFAASGNVFDCHALGRGLWLALIGEGPGCCQVPCQSQNIFPTARLIIIQTTCQQSDKISSSKFSSWFCLLLTWANFLPPSLFLSLLFSFFYNTYWSFSICQKLLQVFFCLLTNVDTEWFHEVSIVTVTRSEKNLFCFEVSKNS